jgi:hypothetical protein
MCIFTFTARHHLPGAPDDDARYTNAVVISGRDENGKFRVLTIGWDGSITVEPAAPHPAAHDSSSLASDAERDRHGALEELDTWMDWAVRTAGHHANNFTRTPLGMRNAVGAAIVALQLDARIHKERVEKLDEEAGDLLGMLRDKDALIDSAWRDLAAEHTASSLLREELNEFRRQIEVVTSQRESVVAERDKLRDELAALRKPKDEAEQWREELAALPLRERVVRCGAKDCMVFIEGNRTTLVVELRLSGDSLEDVERRVRATLPLDDLTRAYVFRELRPTV